MIIYKKPNLAINESKYFKTSFYIYSWLPTWNLIYTTTNFFKKFTTENRKGHCFFPILFKILSRKFWHGSLALQPTFIKNLLKLTCKELSNKVSWQTLWGLNPKYLYRISTILDWIRREPLTWWIDLHLCPMSYLKGKNLNPYDEWYTRHLPLGMKLLEIVRPFTIHIPQSMYNQSWDLI